MSLQMSWPDPRKQLRTKRAGVAGGGGGASQLQAEVYGFECLGLTFQKSKKVKLDTKPTHKIR